jgi:plasmid stability protein
LARLTIRNLDHDTLDTLKARGARHGWSAEVEARLILSAAATRTETADGFGLGTWIHELFLGFEFEVPERSNELPRAVNFDE